MTERRDALFWLLIVLAVTSGANALWMLANPASWYHDLPAAVPDTGPFNAHFVRDIGIAFVMITVAFAWAAFDARWRTPLVVTSAVFVVGHALLHAVDTLRGELEADHWLLDLPGVYLPAIVLAPLAWKLLRSEPIATVSRTRP